MLGTQAAEGWIPATPVDRAAVQAELERVLSDPHFSSSKRYPSFLRFVVSNTLAGHTDLLKERVLGLEVFGRPANYDTTTDPIVRVTAAEIRKRLEQYYRKLDTTVRFGFSCRREVTCRSFRNRCERAVAPWKL